MKTQKQISEIEPLPVKKEFTPPTQISRNHHCLFPFNKASFLGWVGEYQFKIKRVTSVYKIKITVLSAKGKVQKCSKISEDHQY